VSDTTLELLTRAEELVHAWRPSPPGSNDDRFAREACALLDAVTTEHGCEPLLAFLWLPDVDQVQGVLDRVIQRLAWRPDAVQPLLRICCEGALDGDAEAAVVVPRDFTTALYAADVARHRDVAAARASTALWAMALDDLVRGLVRMACGDGDAGLREDALGELAGRGPEVIPALERLADDEELGAAAERCLAHLEEHDMVVSGGSPDTIDDLVYAYGEAWHDEDAEYALWQLAEALENNKAVMGAEELAPVREYIRECVERFTGAEDQNDEDAALGELEVFAGACGALGALLAREEAAQLPVTERTERLHEVVEALSASAVAAPRASAPPPQPPGGASPTFRAALTLPVAELQALTRTPGFRRLQSEMLDVQHHPDFPDWERPAALPPLADRESHEAFVHLALMALYNDPDDESQAIAALSLLGDRAALPLLHLLAAEVRDPVLAEWVRRVIGWDAQLAEAEGVDLATWASTPEQDDDLGIDFLPEGASAPATSSEEAVELEEVDLVPQGADTAPSEPLDAQVAAPEALPAESMAPPSVESMDEAFEEFVRRMERERDE